MKIEQAALIYRGSREGDTCGQVTVARNGVMKPLDPRNDIRKHSVKDLSWGYSGSGPAQLSLAILADYFGRTKEGDRLAESLYQDFKSHAIASQLNDIWELTGAEVGQVLIGILVEDPRTVPRVISDLRTHYFNRWCADHENSEDTADWDNAKIDAWCEEQIKTFLGDYLPLKPETITGFIKTATP